MPEMARSLCSQWDFDPCGTVLAEEAIVSNQDVLTRRGAVVGPASSASSSRGRHIRRVQWYSDATNSRSTLGYPWPVLLTTIIFAAVAMVCVTTGISQFVQHVQDSTRAFRASSAAILLAAGGAQLFLIGAIGNRNLSVINPRLLVRFFS